MERKTKKQWFLAALAGFLLILAMGAGAVFVLYGNYQDQMITAAAMMKEEAFQKEGAKILKERGGTSYEEAKAVLDRLGYGELRANTYGRRLLSGGIGIFLLLAAAYLLFLLLLLWSRRESRIRHQAEMDQIRQVLLRFQNGDYEEDIWQYMDERQERQEIYLQLESLAGYLRVLTGQAQKDREETKALVTDISHQLKTPVAALKACFEILQKEGLSREEREEFSGRCAEQLAGLTQLVNALVNISRMETGMIAIQPESGRIFDTLLEAVNRVYLKAEEKRIELELEAEDALKQMEIPHDRKWLCEAFINLLENAVKYSPQETTVTIRLMKRVSFLRIEIQDQGIGIPKEEQHQIFKRFFRGESKEVQLQTGSGVGLYLTREIIEKHHGTIMVLSGTRHLKGGSMFVLQLPLGKSTLDF